MARGESVSSYYVTPSTRRMRNGRKSEVQRAGRAWAVAIAGHRRAAHGGHRKENCPACAELERKHAAAIAQEGGRA